MDHELDALKYAFGTGNTFTSASTQSFDEIYKLLGELPLNPEYDCLVMSAGSFANLRLAVPPLPAWMPQAGHRFAGMDVFVWRNQDELAELIKRLAKQGQRPKFVRLERPTKRTTMTGVIDD